MKFKYSTVLVSSVIIAFVLLVSSAMAGKRGHRGPPPEAIEACSNTALDQACEFTGRRGETVSGTCIAAKKGDSQTLVCKPSGGRPEGKPGRNQLEEDN